MPVNSADSRSTQVKALYIGDIELKIDSFGETVLMDMELLV